MKYIILTNGTAYRVKIKILFFWLWLKDYGFVPGMGEMCTGISEFKTRKDAIKEINRLNNKKQRIKFVDENARVNTGGELSIVEPYYARGKK